MFGHRSDGVRNDTELGAFFSRMHQTDRIAHGVHEINSAAIRDVNSEANAALICDQAIAAVKTFVLAGRPIDNTNALSVHLLRGNERRAAESMSPPDFPMNAVQPSERFHFIVRHLDIGHTSGETVNDIVQRAQRRELFSQKLTCVHLLEFVRVERLVSTGVRFPAPFNGSGDGFGAGVGTASVFNFRRVLGSSSSFE